MTPPAPRPALRQGPWFLMAMTTLVWGLPVGCADDRKASGARRPSPGRDSGTDSGTDSGEPKAGAYGQALGLSGLRVLSGGVDRPERRFSRGETVEIRAFVTGLESRGRRIRLLSSWKLEDPKGVIVARGEEVPSGEQLVPEGASTEVVETSLSIRLPRGALQGPYKARLAFRDGLGQRSAKREVKIEVVGPTPTGGPGLGILRFHPPPAEDLQAGLPAFVDLELEGLKARKDVLGKSAEAWSVKAEGTAQLKDSSGRIRHRSQVVLLDEKASAPPAIVPLRWGIALPAELEPGSYKLELSIEDLVGGGVARRVHDLKLLPGVLGIYAVRLSGEGGVPRDAFSRGELLRMDLLLSGWRPPADLELDLGLMGPDNGFYLVRKGIHRLSKEDATPPPREVRLTLSLPEFAPAGSWRAKLRLRAGSLGQEASREIPFRILGPEIAPWPSLRVQGLSLRRSKDAPPLPLRLLRAGETYLLDFVAGGMRLVPEGGYYHRVRLVCTLRLWDKAGRVVSSQERACELDKRFSFAPLRIRLSAKWTLPRETLGSHRLEVEVLDLQSNRVSSLQRSVFLLKPR